MRVQNVIYSCIVAFLLKQIVFRSYSLKSFVYFIFQMTLKCANQIMGLTSKTKLFIR